MPSRIPPVELVTFPGLASGKFPIVPARASVRRFASHNSVALNFLARGRMRVLLSTGFCYELNAGRLSVFWGAVPHKIETYEPDTFMYALVLPVAIFLRWSMPSEFVNRLMRGNVFFEPDDDEAPLDLALLKRWDALLDARDTEAEKIVLLELEGRLRRLARACPSPRRLARLATRGRASDAERMLLLIAEHFREPLLPRDIAAAAGLHPDRAGRLFRQRMGLTLTDYIAECRLSHAKTLLATTDANMLDVALDSGFGSVSQFHAIFKRLCGCTPRAYRSGLRSADSTK